ncbi:Mrp/NBP35 family ATP-binding protein [Atopobium fossor]|uniref:Mrp/NBP35 family ATP-binding protein n=1 Tax=Atopobium fossor TaxID=39487 RepID=UPI0003FAD9BA|nr:Mrp/NBP35 family ATP-binding protein [Atopobium fossor]
MAECSDDHPITMTGSDGKPSDMYAENDLSHVKHVIGIVSGKGGVGKSMVTGILATNLMRAGYRVGILDADITGPSIPKMFGMSGKHATGIGNLLLPNVSKHAIKVMSANLVLKNESDPVIWRGPVLAGAIRQFWSETSWGSIDYLLVDMPPGTGDVALTVFKSLPIEGVVIVSSPQDLARMIVGKAVRMAQIMDIPVLGLIENMSYATCPDCGKKIEIFGKSHVDETAAEYDIPVLGRLPIDPAIAAAVDDGSFEDNLPEGLLPQAVELLTQMPEPASPSSDS